MADLWRSARGWSQRKLDELTVDTAELSGGHRFLVVADYVATIVLLAACLLRGAFAQSQIVFDDYEGTHLAALFLSFLVVTLPASVRMLSRMDAVMTLGWVR